MVLRQAHRSLSPELQLDKWFPEYVEYEMIGK